MVFDLDTRKEALIHFIESFDPEMVSSAGEKMEWKKFLKLCEEKWMDAGVSPHDSELVALQQFALELAMTLIRRQRAKLAAITEFNMMEMTDKKTMN